MFFTIMVPNKQEEKGSKQDALWQQRESQLLATNMNMLEEPLVEPHYKYVYCVSTSFLYL